MATTAQLTNVQEPNKPLTEEQQQKLAPPTGIWEKNLAQSIAKSNFDSMERFRSQNHDWRFSNADQLYLAWVPQRTWENTRIPRSSIPIYLALEQIEALLPSVMSALFPLNDNLEVRPRPGTTNQQARAVFDLLMYQFDSLGPDGYTRLEEVVRRCLKQAFIYGNGILELGWKYQETEERMYFNRFVPVRKPILDPASLQMVMMPTGETQCIPDSKVVKKKINQPLIECRDIRDFYIDPNCSSPSVQDARFCATRHLLTLGEVKSYAGQTGFNIPDDVTLTEMAKNKTFTRGDQSKRMTESYRLANWAPQDDYTQDPNNRRVEVIRYWDKQRTVWLLNRDWVMMNQSNIYGILPFIDAFYVDVPNRFYGLAITDVVEGEQRLQQAVINSRIDELALTINAPFAKKRGSSISSSGLRVSPGKVLEFENPKEDFIKIEYPNITQGAYIEVQASEQRAEKVTGITDLAVLGTPAAGGNSAARTATGVSTQAAASGKRIGYLISNLETTLMEPLCFMVHTMNKKLLSQDQVMQVLGKEGQLVELNPLDVMNANVRFEIRSSDKLRSRGMVLQALPLILQTILNPEVMQMLAQQQGLTPDIGQILLMVTDALQVTPMALFRPMDPQEQQMSMMQNPNVQEMMTRMQMQRERLQAQGVHQQDKGDTELLKTIFGQVLQNQGLQKALTGFSATEGNDQSGAAK